MAEAGRRLNLALFGHPVAHSPSPRIHAAFAREAGIELRYETVDCRAGELARRFGAFAESGGDGCNLTVPVKAEGLAVADSLGRSARRAGAVNTLARTDGCWFGDNTDGAGLLADLDRLGLDPASRRVLVLGAGGAVAGVLGDLLDRGPAVIALMNRSPERARSLAGRFPAGSVEVLESGHAVADQSFDFLLQATSLGHSGRVPALSRAWLTDDATAYDLNYGPAHRPFADWCEDHSLTGHDGLGMLVAQAAAAFALWTGIELEPWRFLDEIRLAE